MFLTVRLTAYTILYLTFSLKILEILPYIIHTILTQFFQ